MQKVQGAILKEAFTICEVTNNLINLKNNKGISGKDIRFQLSNIFKICTESLTFLRMTNLEEDNIIGNTYLKFYHQSWPLLPNMSLHHQNFFEVITKMIG